MAPVSRRLGERLRSARYWLTAQVALAALRLLRRMPAHRALAFAEGTARRLGPWTPRHRVALDNLRRAYPDKSSAEVEAIAVDMWGSMARLAAEYIFLDSIFDFDPANRDAGHIEVDGEEIFLRIAGEKAPHIIFTGHLGNFELLPIAGASLGLHVTAMFRPPNNPYIAEYILSTRKAAMGDLLASRKGAAIALSRILERGDNIGVLVDQKFAHGIRTTFFGRECETSPLLPRLARLYECDVYPARCIRLPGNRFKLQIEEKLVLPRGADGTVDTERLAQMLNDTVERWVRETPGQWMWFHKRWTIAGPRKRGRARVEEAGED
jgi:KDO2-lipid IV(A) lauroyltransferase